jgi:hypothetical protein
LRPDASVISPRPNERLAMIFFRRAREAEMDKEGLLKAIVEAGFTRGAVDIPERIAHRQQPAPVVAASEDDKGF